MKLSVIVTEIKKIQKFQGYFYAQTKEELIDSLSALPACSKYKSIACNVSRFLTATHIPDVHELHFMPCKKSSQFNIRLNRVIPPIVNWLKKEKSHDTNTRS